MIFEPQYGDTFLVEEQYESWFDDVTEYKFIKCVDTWTDDYIKQIINYIKIYRHRTKEYRRLHKFQFQRIRHIKGKEYMYIGEKKNEI